MKVLIKYCLVIFIIIYSFSCFNSRSSRVTAAVYHWQTVFDLSREELNWLKENEIKKIYLRVFDIDWNPVSTLPEPVGDVRIITSSLKDVEIIPAVFITNRTIKELPDSLIQQLAGNIVKKVKSKEIVFRNITFNEIQIDCDWTEITALKYFNLLKEIKKIWGGKVLSATIRLHQVKYYKNTGVPPVDKGMLMFYNIGRVENLHTINSIYEKGLAEQYMYNFDKYPLPLDVVLPAFSWGVVFRNKRFFTLLNEPQIEFFLPPEKFKKIADNQYICLNDINYNGVNLKKNDLIRLEIIDPAVTKSAAMLAAKNIKYKTITAALYHLNNGMIKKYESTEINSIINCFN